MNATDTTNLARDIYRLEIAVENAKFDLLTAITRKAEDRLRRAQERGARLSGRQPIRLIPENSRHLERLEREHKAARRAAENQARVFVDLCHRPIPLQEEELLPTERKRKRPKPRGLPRVSAEMLREAKIEKEKARGSGPQDRGDDFLDATARLAGLYRRIKRRARAGGKREQKILAALASTNTGDDRACRPENCNQSFGRGQNPQREQP